MDQRLLDMASVLVVAGEMLAFVVENVRAQGSVVEAGICSCWLM